ncbi:hypothetical protein AXA44_34455 [Rhodococcus sp. SC4]|nr:hypothetical protein AXA44_34455 [Rhodococcus sp. SC4]
MLGEKPVEWGVRTAHDMVARMAEIMPDFAAGSSQFLALQLGVESGVLGVLNSLASGKVTGDGESTEAVQSAREYVHKRIPLALVLATVRRGHSWLTESLMRECTRIVAPDDHVTELTALSELAFEYVDRLAGALGSAYLDEHERWLSTANAVRDEAAHALIAGKDVDVRLASQALRYQVEDRHHIAIFVWQESSLSGEMSLLQSSASKYLDSIGAEGVLLMPQGRFSLWAWGSRRSAFRDNYRDQPFSAGPRLRVTVGVPGVGATGFRQSHLDALEALKVAHLTGIVNNVVVHHRDINLLALLLSNPRSAEQFVARELGSLANNDPQTREIRRTVRSYLETHSPQATAEQLFIARNTVGYRLRRAESVIGHPVTERTVELWAAIVIADATSVERRVEAVAVPLDGAGFSSSTSSTS